RWRWGGVLPAPTCKFRQTRHSSISGAHPPHSGGCPGRSSRDLRSPGTRGLKNVETARRGRLDSLLLLFPGRDDSPRRESTHDPQQRPAHDPHTHKGQCAEEPRPPVPRQHHRQLDHGGEQQPCGHARHARECLLYLRQSAVMLVQYAHADNHEAWPPQEPGHGRRGARPTGEAIPEHHVTLSTFGPGKSCPSVNISTNSRSVIQRCRSISSRRAQKIAPPKLDRLIREKARNNANRLTFGLCVSVCSIILIAPYT